MRYMPLKEGDLQVTVNDGEAEVRLAREVLRLSDLESRLQLLSNDVKQFLGLKALRIVIELPLAEGAQAPKQAEGTAQTSPQRS